MKKEDKEIENILLNDEQYEKFVSDKNEREFLQILEESKGSQVKEISDIKKAPKEKLFSKDATYLVINKNSKTKSYINGVQAEGYLADKNLLREKIISGLSDSFISGNVYVKFFKLRV